MHEAIPRSDLERRPVLPAESGPGEDEEDLLLPLVRVHRGRSSAGVDLDVAQAGRDAPGGATEVTPHAGQRTDLDTAPGDVVPVNERRQGSWRSFHATARPAAFAAGRAEVSSGRLARILAGTLRVGGGLGARRRRLERGPLQAPPASPVGRRQPPRRPETRTERQARASRTPLKRAERAPGAPPQAEPAAGSSPGRPSALTERADTRRPAGEREAAADTRPVRRPRPPASHRNRLALSGPYRRRSRPHCRPAP